MVVLTETYLGKLIQIEIEKDQDNIFGFGLADQFVILIDGTHLGVYSSEVSAEQALLNAKKHLDRTAI